MPANLTRDVVEAWVGEHILAGRRMQFMFRDSHTVAVIAFTPRTWLYVTGIYQLDWDGPSWHLPWLASAVRCLTCGLTVDEHYERVVSVSTTLVVGVDISADNAIAAVVSALRASNPH